MKTNIYKCSNCDGQPNEGILGWVFSHGSILCLKCRNENQISLEVKEEGLKRNFINNIINQVKYFFKC